MSEDRKKCLVQISRDTLHFELQTHIVLHFETHKISKRVQHVGVSTCKL